MFLWIWPWTLVWKPEGIGPVWGFYWAARADRSSAPFDAQEGCGGVCGGGWGGGTLFKHIFYLFSSLIAMTGTAPCTPTTLAGRLTGLKADIPITLHLWWGSGGGQLQPSLVLIWGHRSASVQVIYTSEPRGRRLVSATLKCAILSITPEKNDRKKNDKVLRKHCYVFLPPRLTQVGLILHFLSTITPVIQSGDGFCL